MPVADIEQLMQEVREQHGSRRQVAISSLLDLARLPELNSKIFERLSKLCQKQKLTSITSLNMFPQYWTSGKSWSKRLKRFNRTQAKSNG